MKCTTTLTAFMALATATASMAPQDLAQAPRLPLGLQRIISSAQSAASTASASSYATGDSTAQITFAQPAGAQYKAHTFDQLVTHDPTVPAPHEGATFKQRYWFDATYYKKGGPVFLLDGGETDGEGRLPFLSSGILKILSEATGGLGVVFEHRYYGESFPVANLTTDSFRYLTTMQSLQDSAYFANNVVFPGLEDRKLNAQNVPWIYYGGSYAGAKAAFARSLFPDVFWGGIASSAVTTAVVDFWEYYEPIRKAAPSKCIDLLVNHTTLIDSLLSLSQPFVTSSLKSFFGLPNVTLDVDFVNTLALPLGAWQAKNWDESVGSSSFDEFCDAITSTDEGGESVSTLLEELGFPSLPTDPRKAFASFSGYAKYISQNIVAMCPAGASQDKCFGTAAYEQEGTSVEEGKWKAWPYQFCTEWGYFIGSAPEGHPSLVSRLITTEYTGQLCQLAFPDGELNQVPSAPNVTEINQWGGFELKYPRLAFIDGAQDAWLYATPHSPNARNPQRKDTLKRPFKLIPHGGHHYDENGGEHEPKSIRKVHEEEIQFVQSWVSEWRGKGKWRTGHHL